MGIQSSLFVFIGGCVGTSARLAMGYLIVGLVPLLILPFATLFINILGAFILGYVSVVIRSENYPWKEFWATGVLGSFTTFSAFSADIIYLWNLSTPLMTVYLITSILFGWAAAIGGIKLAKERR